VMSTSSKKLLIRNTVREVTPQLADRGNWISVMNRTQAVMYRVVAADRQAEPNHPEVVGATVAADDGDARVSGSGSLGAHQTQKLRTGSETAGHEIIDRRSRRAAGRGSGGSFWLGKSQSRETDIEHSGLDVCF
jgi:hypothetical protein